MPRYRKKRKRAEHTVVTSVKIPVPLARWLHTESKKQDISRSHLIRRIFEREMNFRQIAEKVEP